MINLHLDQVWSGKKWITCFFILHVFSFVVPLIPGKLLQKSESSKPSFYFDMQLLYSLKISLFSRRTKCLPHIIISISFYVIISTYKSILLFLFSLAGAVMPTRCISHIVIPSCLVRLCNTSMYPNLCFLTRHYMPLLLIMSMALFGMPPFLTSIQYFKIKDAIRVFFNALSSLTFLLCFHFYMG